MSKKNQYKVFIDGTGYNIVEHQIMQPCVMIRKTDDTVLFFSWANIKTVKFDPAMKKIVDRKNQEAAEQAREMEQAQAQAARSPRIVTPPKGVALPQFDPSERN